MFRQICELFQLNYDPGLGVGLGVGESVCPGPVTDSLIGLVCPGDEGDSHPEMPKIMAATKNVAVIRSRIFVLVFMRSS
jgi:hypothetical protein